MIRIVVCTIACSFIPIVTANCQSSIDLYGRLPHIINYQFCETAVTYSQAASFGLTYRYKKFFNDFGAYVASDNHYGYYCYFGHPVVEKPLSHRIFAMNIFGEVAYVPKQQEQFQTWVKMVGVSPVFVVPIDHGALAIAITCGAAFSNEVSLTTRIIFNYSLPIINGKK
ncbi:hypothetical protein [Pseudochryseolinea flava]|uniref:Uncharacterized protein n=1 Tax=Pseudochryseolinea flava TaxID=2059302 RepID=A0A364Y7G8_9BACT|nr:hypothetical protein [Pseudochryseolinea flava]RAW02890.1 hypothetical protein DQQ10_01925 [Pseudochryseolinea flava]